MGSGYLAPVILLVHYKSRVTVINRISVSYIVLQAFRKYRKDQRPRQKMHNAKTRSAVYDLVWLLFTPVRRTNASCKREILACTTSAKYHGTSNKVDYKLRINWPPSNLHS
jgi:hypothetical protein